jgi:hypothetical protein
MHTPSLSRLGPTRRRHLMTVVGLLVALACTDVEAPTASAIPGGAANAVAVAATAAVSAGIEDALDRVAPTLTDERAAKPLQMALENLIDALSQNGTAAATAALERAEGALNAYAFAVGPDSGDAADLDVIALALARVRANFDASFPITN